jgi:L-alanine-DL-glutamate epimerase-like enolase superfamily enzyme
VQVAIQCERWPIRGVFRIARGSRTEINPVTVTLRDGQAVGRGECIPYQRYQESVEGVAALLESLIPALQAGLSRTALQQQLPAGAARNALDCALWDIQAKLQCQPVWQLAGLQPPQAVTTAYTLSIAEPDSMGRAAAAEAQRPVLKLKLAGDGQDLQRVEAVHHHAPQAELIVDANESWQPEDYQHLAPAFAQLGVVLIEQPFPADHDAALVELPHPIPVCADESCHDRSSLASLSGRYEYINIKLDKTGGLTEALALRQAALEQGLGIMVGCMLGTSLAMAPAVLLAQGARYIDLDGPLLLAEDRQPGLLIEASQIPTPDPALWG